MPPADQISDLEDSEPLGAPEPGEGPPALLTPESRTPAPARPRVLTRTGKTQRKRGSSLLPPLVPVLTTIIGVAALAFGIYKFFEMARAHVREQDRFRIAT